MQFTSLNETAPAANPVATAIADPMLATVDQAGEFLAFIADLPQAVAPDKDTGAEDMPAGLPGFCLAFPVSLPGDPVVPALVAGAGLLPQAPMAALRPAPASPDCPSEVALFADFAVDADATAQNRSVPVAETPAGLPQLAADGETPSPELALSPPAGPGETMSPARPADATTPTPDPSVIARPEPALTMAASSTLPHNHQHKVPDALPLQAVHPGAEPGAAHGRIVELAQRVAGQVTSAIVSTADTFLEIRLDPPELGRVQISLEMGDAGVRAVVQAERTDVAELMRRHASLLQDSLQSQGFSGISMEFRSGNDLPQQTDSRQWGLVQTGETMAAPDDLSGPIVNLRQADGGLDIRL